MTQALYTYLLQHKSLSIPGLGSMYIERIPAQTDFVNKRILPPAHQYRFDKYFDAPDKDFFTYLAQQTDMADYEAIKWYNEWAYELRNQIREGHSVDWPGIGKLKKDVSGDVVFESSGPVPAVLQPASAHRVIRSHAQHTMLVGDREVTRELTVYDNNEYVEGGTYVERESWWLYAFIITAIAIILIFFHFYNNNSATATGNQSSIGISTK
jgi:hypothetical protein